MVYRQKNTQYKVSVLTDPSYANLLPVGAITEMRYDRQTDGWVAINPSAYRYPTARTLIKEYRKGYIEKWREQIE